MLSRKNVVVVVATIAAATIIFNAVKRKGRPKKRRVQGILLNWELSASEIKDLGDDIIQRWRALDDSIASQAPNEATFASTFGCMIDLGMELDPIENSITFPKNVSTDDSIREAAKSAEKALAAFGVESGMRRDVYLVLKSVSTRLGKDIMGSEEHRYVEKTLIAYEENGMHLGEDERREVEALKKQIADLEVSFTSNIAEDKTTHLVTAAELAGCPEDFVSKLDNDKESPE